VRRLHPTAALGIFPRSVEAFSRLRQFPTQFRRRSFGAPFGLVFEKTVFIVVGIRSFFWRDSQIEIFSGCGVTEKSQFEEEVEELELKRESVKRMFKL
jgi:menaquinone-specific isochorismate synthase